MYPYLKGVHVTRPGARKALVVTILEASKVRKEELKSDVWTPQVINNRLKNSASKLSEDHWSKRAV